MVAKTSDEIQAEQVAAAVARLKAQGDGDIAELLGNLHDLLVDARAEVLRQDNEIRDLEWDRSEP